MFGSIAGLLGIDIAATVHRIRESLIGLIVIGLFGIIFLVFGLIAASTALTEQVGPIWSPLIIAGVSVLIAIIVAIALSLQGRGRRRRVAPAMREPDNTALIASAALTALPDLLSSPAVRRVGVPLALYGGFLLMMGARPPKPRRQPPLRTRPDRYDTYS